MKISVCCFSGKIGWLRIDKLFPSEDKLIFHDSRQFRRSCELDDFSNYLALTRAAGNVDYDGI